MQTVPLNKRIQNRFTDCNTVIFLHLNEHMGYNKIRSEVVILVIMYFHDQNLKGKSSVFIRSEV